MKIVIDGREAVIPGGSGGGGSGGNPVGTVISFMGAAAPKDYLVCDGAEYSISEYPALAEFFRQQFGGANHFGGDGTTTFCVPDMRNLFMRGYHGEAEEKLSGEIGARQDATVQRSTYQDGVYIVVPGNQFNGEQNVDSIVKKTTSCYRYTQSDQRIDQKNFTYTARPVNMAVLYCIKATNEGGAGGSGSAEIESYGTSDGWHVRKWSDGYMEQTLKKEIANVIINTSWGTGYNSGKNYGPFQYPEAFSELYGVNISGAGSYASMITAYYDTDKSLRLTKTPGIGFFRPSPANVEMDFLLFITAKGRWK